MTFVSRKGIVYSQLDNVKRIVLEREAENLLYEVAMPVTPKDTGDLRESADVGQVELKGGQFVITVGYKAPYAVFVHEKTWKNPTTPGTFPKWFEIAAEQYRPKMQQRIADEIRKAFR